ncbi:hypothetical protein D3C87_2019580 [compost metagenome]
MRSLKPIASADERRTLPLPNSYTLPARGRRPSISASLSPLRAPYMKRSSIDLPASSTSSGTPNIDFATPLENLMVPFGSSIRRPFGMLETAL